VNVARPTRTLVLSNALGTTAAMWDPQLPALGAFHVVRYEHPPYTSVAELGREVLRLVPGRFSLCGLSLGGMVGMWLAACVPERIDRLVLACTSARFGVPAEWAERAALVRVRGMGAVAEDALEKWFTPAFRAREPFLRMQLETPAEDYAAGLEAIGSFDFRDQLGRIAAATLVVAGAEDAATTPADAAFIADRIPDARLVVIEGAAHLANVERADAFTAALLEHLR
jgi:3-oxoadipate enol-lactonase